MFGFFGVVFIVLSISVFGMFVWLLALVFCFVYEWMIGFAVLVCWGWFGYLLLVVDFCCVC